MTRPSASSAWPVIMLTLAVAACTQLPPRTDLPYFERPSPNFSERRPNFVVIHHTSSRDVERALFALTDPLRRVSAHYVIARDGTLYYLVDEMARAWHAGRSYWGGHRDLNSASIGIELDNDGEEPFAEAQIATLLLLLADVQARYGIPAANFLGHADVSPGRKADPSRLFPWRTLAAHGFGLWCDPPYPPVLEPAGTATLLAALGYDVSDPAAAISAFRLRYLPDDTTEGITDEHRALMHCLLDLKFRERPMSGADDA